MNEQSIIKVIADQQTYFKTGLSRDLADRKNKLKALKASLVTHENDIIAALKKDLGRPSFETFSGELYIIFEEINFALKNIDRWVKPHSLPGSFITWPSKTTLIAEPYGVVLILAPWNFPILLALSPLVGAIAAGNCAIIKPSEFAPAAAQLLSQIIAEVFDPAHVTVIEGEADTAEFLTKQPFDHIFFTGSPRVGKLVMSAAAQNLVPLTLELGGKNPCIIDARCNIAKTAARIVWGKFINAGQNCLAPDFLLVDIHIKKKLVEELKKYIKKFYGADPEKSSSYGRIMNNVRFLALKELLKDCSIHIGGQTNEQDLYIAPTLIDNPPLDHPIMQEEIFGPLLPIKTYETIEDALELIHKYPKPLALYLFSDDKNVQKKIMNQTSSGGITINDVILHGISPKIPFGGVGYSGFGRYHGKYTFETFSHYKPVLKKPWFELPLRYPPYGYLQKMATKVLKFFGL